MSKLEAVGGVEALLFFGEGFVVLDWLEGDDEGAEVS